MITEVGVMKSRIYRITGVLVVMAGVVALALCGCEGSDAGRSVTRTVEDLVGKNVVDQKEKIKRDIDQAMKQEGRRLLHMDERGSGDSPEEPAEQQPGE